MKTRNGNQSRWRKSRKRGVSPIIATILLVAITVVLAAVLYVLISGLTRGPGNTPIGSAMAVGSANEAGGCKTYCNYTFTIQSASSGVSANSIKIQVQSTSGGILTYTNARLIDVSSCLVAYYAPGGPWVSDALPATPTGDTATACATSISAATQISSGDQIILTTTTPLASAGDSMVIVGTGSYSGTITAAIP